MMGVVNGTTVVGQSLLVTSSGVTTFGSSVGSTIPLSTFTTDAPGTSVFGGGITVSGAAPTPSTPLISVNDAASGTGANNFTLSSTNGGQILVNNGTSTFPLTINTSGSVVIAGAVGTTLGSPGAPLILTQTPLNVQTLNASFLNFVSPGLPPGLIFAPGSSVIGNGALLAANASQQLQGSTVSSVQGTAAAAVAEASKAGFDTDSVAQQINYGFAGDVGVSPPMNHTIDETGVSVPEGFGEEAEDEEEEKKKKK